MTKNHSIFLKYDGNDLLWSSERDGTYEEVTEDKPNTPINGDDTITFTAVSGIAKIQKIDDGIKGTKKMFKGKKGEDTNTVVATVTGTTEKDYIYKYSIKFKSENGGKSITVDPSGTGGGRP